MAIRVDEKLVDRRARCNRCEAKFRFRDALLPGQMAPPQRESSTSIPTANGTSTEIPVSAAGKTSGEIPVARAAADSNSRAPSKASSPTNASSGTARTRTRPAKSATWFDELGLDGREEAEAPNTEASPSSTSSYFDDDPLPNPPLLPRFKRSKRRRRRKSWWSHWAGAIGAFAALLVLIWIGATVMRSGSLADLVPLGPANTQPAVAEWAATHPLYEVRKGYHTNLTSQISAGSPVPVPPSALFRVVEYESAVGGLAAYVTPDPGDGGHHPAIIWLCGGDCNSIEDVWHKAPADNDQTAAAFRKAGIVMMFPSLRGGNGNPGHKEGFFGEVEDVLSAAKYLAQQPYVDAERIYLGGHSTGGTLALLVAESSNRFRAVFSFGPVANVASYGADSVPISSTDYREVALRSPGVWLHSIRGPVFVMEGQSQGNVSELLTMSEMAQKVKNSLVQFLLARGANHFSILAPANQLIAQKILRDEGSTTNMSITDYDLNALFSKPQPGSVAANATASSTPGAARSANAPSTGGRSTTTSPPAGSAPPNVSPRPAGPTNRAPRQPGHQPGAPRPAGF
jgi:alpha/beta superfamily hydrolase